MTRPLSEVQNFLLDMDGTLYLGDELIPGALDFLATLRATGRRLVFLTNNSSRSRSEYVARLARFGITAAPEEIFSSADATVHYLQKRKPGARLYVLCVPSVEPVFRDAGFTLCEEKPDFAVLCFDTTLSYARLRRFCDHLQDGVPFIASHPDFNCPIAGGRVLPDAGAMAAMITAVTDVSPTVIGKPERPMAEAVLESYGFDPDRTAMVGDRLYTDIAFGASAGIRSVLVLSGETSLADYKAQSRVHADYIYPSVREMISELEEKKNG